MSPRNWPDLDALPGVTEAVESARGAISSARRMPSNRRDWPRGAAAAGIRAARASSVLAGGDAAIAALDTDDSDDEAIVTDPILAGALRVTAAIGELAAVWSRAPLQALARLHTLAAADLAGADALGRPRPEAAPRLTALADVVVSAPWSAPVMVAVVQGELLAIEPFGAADGVVARAAARLTMVATGLDPQALTVPEVGYLRARDRYSDAARAFAAGDSDGVTRWIILVCEAMKVGAKEAKSIATAMKGGLTPELKHAALPNYLSGT